MSQIAGFRRLVWDTSKVDIARVARAPLPDPREAVARGDLVRDATRAVYRYHQVFSVGTRMTVRKSWFGALALESWTEGMVRRHEASDPTALLTELARMTSSGIHSEAVLVGYRDAAGEVDRMFRKLEVTPPMHTFTTSDGTEHKIWRCGSAEIIGKLRPLFAPKALYVLDGASRYESMVSYRGHLAATEALAVYSSANFGLACFVNLEDPALAVGARHRVVRADGVTPQTVLDAAKRYFFIDRLGDAAKDIGKQAAALAETLAHQPAFIVLFPGESSAWKLTLSPDVSPVAEGVVAPRGIQKYDPFIVDQLFLRVVAPAASVEVVDDPGAVVTGVASGATLGLILRPLTIEQIVHVGDVGGLLPAASTVVVPPVARHLVAYVVDPSEDVV